MIAEYGPGLMDRRGRFRIADKIMDREGGEE